MDPTTLTALIQSIVQIVTIVGSIWALFNKKTKELEDNFELRLNKLDYRLTSMKNKDIHDGRP